MSRIHTRYPWLLDCRPIPVCSLISNAGYEIKTKTALFNIQSSFAYYVCPHGDSNSGLNLERVMSWSPRRWGHVLDN